MAYNLLIDGVYWGYNPLTNHLLSSWDIQVDLALNEAAKPWETKYLDPLVSPKCGGFVSASVFGGQICHLFSK